MQVETEQLIPGTILSEDVLGKSGRPIVPKNSALTERQIKVLKKFLVSTVKVSPRLADGTPFRIKKR